MNDQLPATPDEARAGEPLAASGLLADEERCTAEEWAEAIIMAVEVGMFEGTETQYAHALLVIANRDKRESANSITQPQS